MIETLYTLQAVDLFLIPAVVGLVQAVKMAGTPSRFSPLFALAFGVGLEALVGGSVARIVIVGIVVGLSAAGLYSGVKKTAAPRSQG